MKTESILVVVMACVAMLVCISVAEAINPETVTVGNLYNVGELSGGGLPSRITGGVDYAYNIGKFEVTAGQYTEFLNAVAATDTFGLYNTNMWNHTYSNKIQRSGSSGSYSYSVATDWANRPVSFISWGDAARFCNWLHNGKPTGAQDLTTTEDGSYKLNNATSEAALMAVSRKKDATWVIPSEDEWYKAAYHKNDGVTGNYFDYPTGSDSTPSNNLINPDPGNNANFYQSGGYTIGSPYWRTEVGEFENSESPYGTFDQGGNVWEWTEGSLFGNFRLIRGGSFWNDAGGNLEAWYRNVHSPASEIYHIGLRVAFVPEPAKPPVADADGPYTIYVGDTLTLDASGSADADNDIVSYIWDLDDDGIFETDAGGQAIFDVNFAYLQSLGLLINHTYNIHVKVTDSKGQNDIASSTLTILPKPAVKVAVDIKPGSCSNPVNVKSSGVLPVAILGTADYDITTIDPTSIRLAGVEPLRSGYEDVAGPVSDVNDCNCTTDGPDGFLDLTLKFETQRIVEAIGEVNDGDVLTLELTGVLFDPIPFETPIEGADCILIRGRHKPINPADINKDGVVNAADFAILAQNWLQSSVVED